MGERSGGRNARGVVPGGGIRAAVRSFTLILLCCTASGSLMRHNLTVKYFILLYHLYEQHRRTAHGYCEGMALVLAAIFPCTVSQRSALAEFVDELVQHRLHLRTGQATRDHVDDGADYFLSGSCLFGL